MANRFMEQYAGPSGAEQHGHLARRGVDRAQIDERLVQRLVDCAVPLRLLEQMIVPIATAEAEIARFAAAILLDHDRDVEADERADIGRGEAVGADDLDHRQHGRASGRVSGGACGLSMEMRVEYTAITNVAMIRSIT